MASEFELIDRYFKRPTSHTRIGVGDDGAVLSVTPGMELVVTTDMLVAGTHFLADTDAESLGWKTLAVNVSDLAAMGATPRWAVVAAALPDADEAWIEKFSRGLFACADAFGLDVIGGDTTRGPLNLCPTVFGEVPRGQALLRSGAKVGDEVWLSGTPGLAALGLAHLKGQCQLAEPALTNCLAALYRPQPRVELGVALRGIANAAIDVSDGLAADLTHILKMSKVAAQIEITRLPQAAFAACRDRTLAMKCALAGGDDYELLFTAPPSAHAQILKLATRLSLPLSAIGRIEDGARMAADRLQLRKSGQPMSQDAYRGFDHFASQS